MTAIYGLHGSGRVSNERGDNVLDSGAHYYGVYECSDGGYVSVGSIEAQVLRRAAAEQLGLERRPTDSLGDRQRQGRTGPAYKEQLAAIFRTRTRDEWCAIMEGTDICFAPGARHGRGPRPSPQRGPGHVRGLRRRDPAGAGAPLQPHAGRHPAPPATRGEHTEEVLTDWGFTAGELDGLRVAGAIK